MPSLPSSNSRRVLLLSLTWLMRFFIGAVFVFSGITKGIDVWGTLFKFNDYLGAWGLETWHSVNLVGALMLCIAEFLTGFCLILGCLRRAAPVAALLLMAIMLPLTLWIAVKNPVADCGCFGDALKLTNWQTFYKNIVITAGVIWLLIYNGRLRCLINPYLQWIALVAAGMYFLCVALIGYFYQPLIDFRPYRVGTALVEESPESEEADEDQWLRFVYEKDGARQEFGIDDILPDEADGWQFVERYYALPEDGETESFTPAKASPHEKNIRFFSEDGREDLTEEAVGEGRQLILMIPDLSEVSAAKSWKINSLYDWCNAHDIEMIATVGGNPYEIGIWKDLSLAEYPIYTSDDTVIEEVVRGNPALVYIEDGIIRWKSSLSSVNIDDFQNGTISSDPMAFARDNARILRTLTWIFLAVVALLVLLSFSPMLLMKIIRGSKPKENDIEKELKKEKKTDEQQNAG